VVTAGRQSAGRGRQGRTWTAPAGKALLYSAVLRPLDERHLLLPLAIPLAVCEAAEELKPEVACQVKWPNDVWLEERKLAGVLIEARPQDGWAVIGVGLNLSISRDEFPPELRDTATSLSGASEGSRGRSDGASTAVAPEGLPPTPFTAAEVLSRHLDRWVEAEPNAILDAWRRRDALKGREVSWDDGAGVADGIEDSGGLVVLGAGGDRLVLGAGEVHLRL
jgi:BirA family biotin operon repressor/biotin-[acetyl-CoA-carboxylase] ligase